VDLYPYPTAPLYFNSPYGKNGSGKISPAEEGSPLSRLLEAAKPPARLVLARAWQVSSRRASGAAGVPSTVRVNGDVLYMRCEMLRRAFLCGIEAKRPPAAVFNRALKIQQGFNRALELQQGFRHGPYNSMGISIGPLNFNRGFRHGPYNSMGISIGPLKFNRGFDTVLTIQ
jgi:hypothetical protein